ncbi:hypothetical protein SDC9_182817 [bioreactor metagenome]|uniref:Uncharacterized protein n=1 Tax=bioreactor metagenome TaxID=1076179 RepID=A0A645H9E3_9ZZZZ
MLQFIQFFGFLGSKQLLDNAIDINPGRQPGNPGCPIDRTGGNAAGHQASPPLQAKLSNIVNQGLGNDFGANCQRRFIGILGTAQFGGGCSRINAFVIRH